MGRSKCPQPHLPEGLAQDDSSGTSEHFLLHLLHLRRRQRQRQCRSRSRSRTLSLSKQVRSRCRRALRWHKLGCARTLSRSPASTFVNEELSQERRVPKPDGGRASAGTAARTTSTATATATSRCRTPSKSISRRELAPAEQEEAKYLLSNERG